MGDVELRTIKWLRNRDNTNRAIPMGISIWFGENRLLFGKTRREFGSHRPTVRLIDVTGLRNRAMYTRASCATRCAIGGFMELTYIPSLSMLYA